MSITKDKLFKCTKEAYQYMSNKDAFGLPDSFEMLSPAQQDFFLDFFDFCKEVEYELDEQDDKGEDFLMEVRERLGTSGESVIENLLYEKGLKVISED